MLDDSRLEALAWCQTQTAVAGTAMPIMATNRDGTKKAQVPAGQRWIVAAILLVNTDAANARNVYVWFVPANRALASTTTTWLRVPGISVAALATEKIEAPTSARGVDVLYPDDAIWIMGSAVAGNADAVNVVVLGYRVPL